MTALLSTSPTVTYLWIPTSFHMLVKQDTTMYMLYGGGNHVLIMSGAFVLLLESHTLGIPEGRKKDGEEGIEGLADG